MVADLQSGGAELSSFHKDGEQGHSRTGFSDMQLPTARPAHSRDCAGWSHPYSSGHAFLCSEEGSRYL